MNILFIGANGLLGRYLTPEILKYDGDGTLMPRVYVDTPKREELDITNPFAIPYSFIEKKYDLIILAAAYVDVPKAEIRKKECFETNVQGVMNVCNLFPETPIVYISTEYAHNPVNYYSETKLAAETAIKAQAASYLIIRTLFKPKPFPYVKAFENQWTQGDYVDVIAPLMADEIMTWRTDKNALIYVGTGRKTMLELARRTVPEIDGCSVDDVSSVKIPKDYQ